MFRFQILIVFIAVFVSGCQQNGPIRKRTAEQWTATAQQIAELQPRSSYEGYSLQLPNSFKEQTVRSNVKQPELFVSKDNKTNIRVEYGATIYGGRKPSSAEELVLVMSRSLENELDNFQQSPPEVGMIGDVEFAKKTWSGVIGQNNSPITGTMFSAIIDQKMVMISVQNVGEGRSTDLDLAEASIYTFLPE